MKHAEKFKEIYNTKGLINKRLDKIERYKLNRRWRPFVLKQLEACSISHKHPVEFCTLCFNVDFYHYVHLDYFLTKQFLIREGYVFRKLGDEEYIYFE